MTNILTENWGTGADWLKSSIENSTINPSSTVSPRYGNYNLRMSVNGTPASEPYVVYIFDGTVQSAYCVFSMQVWSDLEGREETRFRLRTSTAAECINIKLKEEGSGIFFIVGVYVNGGMVWTDGPVITQGQYYTIKCCYDITNRVYSVIIDGVIITSGTLVTPRSDIHNFRLATGTAGVSSTDITDFDGFIVDDTEFVDFIISDVDLVDGRILQRINEVADIVISGEFIGDSELIEYRVVNDGTDDVVSGHNWQTLDSTPSAGKFSGTVNNIPQGGWYNIDIRSTSMDRLGTEKIGVGILIGCIGQSNIARWFSGGSGQIPNTLVRKYTVNGWSELGTEANGATAFANRLVETLELPIGLLSYGVGSSALLESVADTHGYWLDFSNDPYAAFKDGVDDVGGSLEYVLWAQGEREGVLGTITESDYINGLISFVSKLREDIENGSKLSNLPFLISGLGRIGADDDTMQIVRDAQYSTLLTDPCSFFAATTIDLELEDGVHYTYAEQLRHGVRCAQTVLYILGEVSYYRGPRIVNAVKGSATTILLTIDHEGGTDFTPSTGITGFSVLDDGVAMTLSSVDRTDENTITLTLSDAMSGAITVRYLYGGDPDITGVVVDNTMLALPMEIFPFVRAPKKVNITDKLNAEYEPVGSALVGGDTLRIAGIFNHVDLSALSGTGEIAVKVSSLGRLSQFTPNGINTKLRGAYHHTIFNL